MASGDDFMSRRKAVPIRLNEFSVLDSEFDNIRYSRIKSRKPRTRVSNRIACDSVAFDNGVPK